MNIKKILSYTGLGLVTALIITVIVLAFVPVSISPTFANTATETVVNQTKPDAIKIYKKGDTTQYYLVSSTSSVVSEKNDYNNILNAYNKMGTYSVLDTIFSGVAGQKYQVNYTGSNSTSISTLTGSFDYVVQLIWDEDQNIVQANGEVLSGANVTSTNKFFKSIAFGVTKDGGSQTTELSIFTASNYNYWKFVAFANTSALYNLVDAIDDGKFA